jgi:hypothetical protein
MAKTLYFTKPLQHRQNKSGEPIVLVGYLGIADFGGAVRTEHGFRVYVGDKHNEDHEDFQNYEKARAIYASGHLPRRKKL